MTSTTKAWLQIHLCVVLWGFTAILGKLITMDALPLVLWRMALVAIILLLLPSVLRSLRELPVRLTGIYIGIGILVTLHWLTFYGAIRLSNASVAVTCIATVPVFLAVLEPILAGRRFQPSELLLGLMVLPGIVLVVGGTPEEMNGGIVMGLVSAMFVALFAALNKRYVLNADALTVTAIEMAAGAVMLLVIGLLYQLLPGLPEVPGIVESPADLFALPRGNDVLWLLILALGCTLLPFALSLVALRQLSAYASSLAVNLEPLYAIALAIVLLGEQQEVSAGFYAGAALIVTVVLIYPWWSRRGTVLAQQN
ncbi:DMT family transporter [Gammaproteobacteria bacterium LSUCC0112]|nr:DMT family transporter [Gammaproteobacteria bacterium LSUCC0112]